MGKYITISQFSVEYFTSGQVGLLRFCCDWSAICKG